MPRKNIKQKKPLKRAPQTPGRKPADRARMDEIRPRLIHLEHPIRINDKLYGPGSVKVRSDVAAQLLEMDQNARRADAAFSDRNGRAYIIEQRAPGQLGKRQVPYGSFDSILTREFENPSVRA